MAPSAPAPQHAGTPAPRHDPDTGRRLRWYIGALLFLSTVINYIDRQTLNVLAPILKTEFSWSNTDFALLVIAFRAAYAVGQTASGRWLDRIGTRAGLTIAVAFYSTAAILSSLATGLRSFAAFRFLLGLGESANWPGATKAVAEWFPKRESGWAVALFDSGSSVGAALAPFIVLTVHRLTGSWRPAFIVTGVLGFLWIPLFRLAYRRARVAAPATADLTGPPADLTGPPYSVAGVSADAAKPAPYRVLLSRPETWGIIGGKGLTDPVWFFITDWFAIFLVSRGFRLEDSLLAFWVPFLAADLGNFAGGGLSSALIARGWRVLAARKFVIVAGTVGMLFLIPAVYTTSLHALAACFAVATFSYAAVSTMILNLPADVVPEASVASVAGLGGTSAGIGTIGATYLTGYVADRFSFEPLLIGASLIPLVAMGLVLVLMRDRGGAEAPPYRTSM